MAIVIIGGVIMWAGVIAFTLLLCRFAAQADAPALPREARVAAPPPPSVPTLPPASAAGPR